MNVTFTYYIFFETRMCSSNITHAPPSYGPRGLTFVQMALSPHQLDKAKKAIEFLSSLPTGSVEGSGTSGASRSIPTQSTSVRGSINLSESRSSDAIKTEKGEYWYL